MTRIILNSIKCNNCKTTATSHWRHNFSECLCGEVAADGGNDYLRRIGNNYTELSVDSDAPFEVIRESIYWGSRGKDGKQPMVWVVLAQMTDTHLESVLEYHKRNNSQFSLHGVLQRYEKHYRINNINSERIN